MTGHVIYACLCLNVQIQLANKYYLEGHENYRKEKFIRLEQPPLSGWIFDTGKGISIAYPSLIRIQKKDDWFTINCHNCATEVCSIERKDTEELQTTRYLPGDRLMIHQKTIFGQAIDELSKKPTYSDIFHVILNPDLPIENFSIDKDKNVPSSLEHQYEQVQRLLKKSCSDLERQTDLKIQAYQEEQKLHLAREKEKANYDAAVLWQTMKEVSKSSTNSRRLSSLIKPPSSFQIKVSDNVIFNRVDKAEQRDLSLRDISMDAEEYDMFKSELHAEHHPIEYQHHEMDPNHFINQRRRRSSAFKTSNRRSSYILDESAIANSLKKISHPHHPLVPVPERRRPSLQFPQIIGSSESSSSWEDERVKEEEEEDNNSEEMFPLDEDILDDASINFSKRRESKKYLDINEDEENEADLDNKDEQETTQKPNYTIACSVPISIDHRPSPKINHQTNGIQPKKTFLGFDYAKADREVSSHLPPVDNRRKSIANGVLMSNTQDVDENEMIPPHILVANTYTGGAEAMFGSVPRGSVRFRPVE